MTYFRLCSCCDRSFDAVVDMCPVDNQPLALIELSDKLIGSTLGASPTNKGKYSLIEVLGCGATSTVYKATQLGLTNRYVAAKVLHKSLGEYVGSVRRFEQEAYALAKIGHPNIVSVFDHGVHDDHRLYIVMEYIEGVDLQKAISKNIRINYQIAVPWFAQIASALHYAHQQGVVHRGLKPSEIMISNNGRATLLDFGLAKLMPWSGRESMHLTQTGEILGTAVYASPEQIKGEKIEPSTDIYSLGVIMYEALTGRPPFTGTSPYEIAQKHINSAPPSLKEQSSPLEVPLWLEQLVGSMLEKQVTRRPITMEICARALRTTAQPTR